MDFKEEKAMAIKTKVTEQDVFEFIEELTVSPKRKEDAQKLVDLMEEHTGYPPKMWGPSIIGFGQYHYKSTRSAQEGDWPLVGFSPRKTALSLYVYAGTKRQEELLEKLGKYSMGKACIYVKKLEDIDFAVLKEMMDETIKLLAKE